MIDLFAVVSFGGLIRWSFVSHKFDHLKLLNSVLKHLSTLDDLKSESVMTIGNNLMKWSVNEEFELIYILGHPKMFPLDWTENLFKKIDNFIIKEFSEALKTEPFFEFEDLALLTRFKEAVKKEELRSKSGKMVPRTNLQIDHNANYTKNTKNADNNLRTWSDKVSKKEIKNLDYSSNSSNNLTVKAVDFDLKEPSKIDELSDFESSDSEFIAEEIEAKRTSSSWWSSFKSLTGNNPLTLEDLQPALKAMKIHLIEKNVASNSADFVVKAVGNRLEGRIPGTFLSISKMVKEATRETLQKILTPTKPNDLLNEIEMKHKKPFVMAFIGVNGVGKSTNLSKVAFWLLQHQFRVLLVAGDTFRAGAIEQLAHHARNLSNLAPNRIELYERGYGKDAALMAQDAIRYASQNGFDLVLIDTAGRMQDNGPLMIALAKLISLNKPDRVIFVGEALVGNDALSQLQKFNSALLDHSAKPIDGILLTKVDTIDDKIGAALSMTLTSKAPILFTGVGQTYTDLRRINIRQVVDLLLK